MQKELANILKGKLLTLPFIDLVAGLAQTLTTTDQDETNSTTIQKRRPVAVDAWNGKADCFGREVSLIPDSSRKSIIYFEDFGIVPGPFLHGQQGYLSSLRLVCWLNRAKLVGDMYAEISGRVEAAIIATLCHKNPENIGIFQRLAVNFQRIPQQDAGIFGRYTYKEEDRQYLRPPFEFFAIDLSSVFYVSAKCLDQIPWNVEACA
jgi:hypothetical protein